MQRLPNPSLASRQWFWIVSAWLVFALLNATQTTVGMRAEGMYHAWTRLFMTLLLSWAVWVLATPWIVWLGRRYPPGWKQPASVWLIHFAACTFIAVVAARRRAALQQLLHPWEPDIVNIVFSQAWLAIAWHGSIFP